MSYFYGCSYVKKQATAPWYRKLEVLNAFYLGLNFFLEIQDITLPKNYFNEIENFL